MSTAAGACGAKSVAGTGSLFGGVVSARIPGMLAPDSGGMLNAPAAACTEGVARATPGHMPTSRQRSKAHARRTWTSPRRRGLVAAVQGRCMGDRPVACGRLSRVPPVACPALRPRKPPPADAYMKWV